MNLFYQMLILFFINTGFCGYNREFNNDIINYLHKFGFLSISDNSMLNSKVIVDALHSFHKFYNITEDSKLDIETFMKKKRCGNKDIKEIENYSIRGPKWNKNIISWYFFGANDKFVNVAQEAFSIWERHSKLSFIKKIDNPDIIIYSAVRNHTFLGKNEICNFEFDGNGIILAHAYFPDGRDNQVEIHLDRDEKYFGDTSKESLDFLFKILLHEIGHTLGLSHSANQNAVMYPFYQDGKYLHQDDINGLQYLYGEKENPPNLCNISNPSNLFVIDNILYVSFDKWLWKVNITNNDIIASINLKDRHQILFSLLTNNKGNVYSDNDNNIVVLSNNVIYIFDSDLNFKYRKNLTFRIFDIDSIFYTVRGKIYILYNNNKYKRLNQYFNYQSYGDISSKFNEIPSKINNVLKYIDGNLYFFSGSFVYQYNEYLNKVTSISLKSKFLRGLLCKDKYLKQKISVLLRKINQ